MGALLLVLCLSQGEPPEGYVPRLQERLKADYPELDPATRERLARTYAAGISSARDYGYKTEKVFEIVDWKLSKGATGVRQIQAQAASLAERAASWVPEAPALLAVPDSYRIREREANLSGVEAYLSEVLPRRPATDEEKQAILAQLTAVGNEVRAQAGRKIFGAYGRAIIDKNVDLVLQDQNSEYLGNPVYGALTRPMTTEELNGVLAKIRAEIEAAPLLEASSEADRLFAETGETEVTSQTPAMRLAARLGQMLYSFGEITYPRTTLAVNERDQAVREANEWMVKAWAPVKEELQKKGVRTLPRSEVTFQKPALPKAAAGNLPASSPTPPAAPSSRKVVDAPAEPRGSWGFFVLLGAAAIAALLYFRFRPKSAVR